MSESSIESRPINSAGQTATSGKTCPNFSLSVAMQYLRLLAMIRKSSIYQVSSILLRRDAGQGIFAILTGTFALPCLFTVITVPAISCDMSSHFGQSPKGWTSGIGRLRQTKSDLIRVAFDRMSSAAFSHSSTPKVFRRPSPRYGEIDGCGLCCVTGWEPAFARPGSSTGTEASGGKRVRKETNA